MIAKSLLVVSFSTLMSISLVAGAQSSSSTSETSQGASSTSQGSSQGSTSSSQSPSSTTEGSASSKTKSSGSDSSSGLSMSDKKFIKDAADGGLAEVELGQLAASKGSSDEVKKFGQRMVDDHGKANDQLKQLASSKQVNLPTEPSAKHK